MQLRQCLLHVHSLLDLYGYVGPRILAVLSASTVQ